MSRKAHSKEATIFQDYFDLRNPGLRAYFGIVEKGTDEVIRTTFAKGQDFRRVLSSWIAQLEPLKSTWPTLMQFEIDLSKKVGPMSVMKPVSERMDDIESYYASVKSAGEAFDPKAIAAFEREWRKVAGLRIKSQTSTVLDMKKSTNSGSPFFTKRRKVIKDTLPIALRWSEQEIVQVLAERTPAESVWKACAVLGWRGQEGGPNPEDVKQRVVWMFPFAVNIAELQVYQPLIAAAQKHQLVPAWVGLESVDMAITRLFDTKPKDDLVVCTDFKSFDQHFNTSMQECTRQCLASLMSGPGVDDWFANVFPIKYSIPLAYMWDHIRFGFHGMGSGSGGTNADETLAHRCLQHEAAITAGRELNPYSQCLGDDGILSYPGITVEQVQKSYERHGLEMQTTKQYASAVDCQYLRRWHHVNYRVDGVMVGVYATTRALGRMMFMERKYDPDEWGPKQVALRQLAILENVKNHPMKEQFVQFCMRRDKYRLGIDIPGFLGNVDTYAEKAMAEMPDFLGYTRSLSNDVHPSKWWIVQYLESLA